MLGVSQRAAAVGGTERAAGLETILANRGVTTKNDASPSTSPPDPWAKELPFFFLVMGWTPWNVLVPLRGPRLGKRCSKKKKTLGEFSLDCLKKSRNILVYHSY